jgi:hypothetical protein
MKVNFFEEQIFFSGIRISIANEIGSSIGTGFIVSVPLNSINNSLVLLVSNRHVFNYVNGTIALNFHTKMNGLDEPHLGKIINININNFSNI